MKLSVAIMFVIQVSATIRVQETTALQQFDVYDNNIIRVCGML